MYVMLGYDDTPFGVSETNTDRPPLTVYKPVFNSIADIENIRHRVSIDSGFISPTPPAGMPNAYFQIVSILYQDNVYGRLYQKQVNFDLRIEFFHDKDSMSWDDVVATSEFLNLYHSISPSVSNIFHNYPFRFAPAGKPIAGANISISNVSCFEYLGWWYGGNFKVESTAEYLGTPGLNDYKKFLRIRDHVRSWHNPPITIYINDDYKGLTLFTWESEDAFKTFKITQTAGGDVDQSGLHYLVKYPYEGYNEHGQLEVIAIPDTDNDYKFKGWRFPDGIIRYGSGWTEEIEPGVFKTIFDSRHWDEGTYSAIFVKPKSKLTVKITVSGRGKVTYKSTRGNTGTINTHLIQPRTKTIDVPEGKSIELLTAEPMDNNWELSSVSPVLGTIITNDFTDYQSHTATIDVVFARVDEQEEEEDVDDEDDPGGIPSSIPSDAGDPSIPDDRRQLTISVDYQNGATSTGSLYTLGMVTKASVTPDDPTRSTSVIKNLDYSLVFNLSAGDIITSAEFNGSAKTVTDGNTITVKCTADTNWLDVVINRMGSRIIHAKVISEPEPPIGMGDHTLSLTPAPFVTNIIDAKNYVWGTNDTAGVKIVAAPVDGFKIVRAICYPSEGNQYDLGIAANGLSVNVPATGGDLYIELIFSINEIEIEVRVRSWNAETDKFGLVQMTSASAWPDPLPVGSQSKFVAGMFCGVFRKTGMAYNDSTGVTRALVKRADSEDWVELTKVTDQSKIATFKVPTVNCIVEIVMYCTVNCSVGMPPLSTIPGWPSGEDGGYGRIRLTSLDPYNWPTGDDGVDAENHSIAEMERPSDTYWNLDLPHESRPAFYPFVRVEIGSLVRAEARGGLSGDNVEFHFAGFYDGNGLGYAPSIMRDGASPFDFQVIGDSDIEGGPDAPAETGGLVKVKARFLSELGVRYVRIALADQNMDYATVHAKMAGATQITKDEYWDWRGAEDPDAIGKALYFKFEDNDGSGEIKEIYASNYGVAGYFQWRKRPVVASSATEFEWKPVSNQPYVVLNSKPTISVEYEIEIADTAPVEGDPVDVIVGYGEDTDAEWGEVYYSPANAPEVLLQVPKTGDLFAIEEGVPQGTEYLLMAVPAEGYDFLGWFDGDNIELTKAASWTPVITEQLHEFYAKFIPSIIPPNFINVFVGYADKFSSINSTAKIIVNGEESVAPDSGEVYEFATRDLETLVVKGISNSSMVEFDSWRNEHDSVINRNDEASVIDEHKMLISPTWLLLVKEKKSPDPTKVRLRIITNPARPFHDGTWVVYAGGNTVIGNTRHRSVIDFDIDPEEIVRIKKSLAPSNMTLNGVFVNGAYLGTGTEHTINIPSIAVAGDLVVVTISYKLSYVPPPDRPLFEDAGGHGTLLLEGTREPKTFVWRSRRYEMKVPDAPQTVKVWFDAKDSNSKFAIVRFYGYTQPDIPCKPNADVSLRITEDNMRRIPIMRKQHFWEFEIESDCPIKRLCIGTSATLVATGGKRR